MELFISDLDGTLLNGNAEVTEFTRDTLNRLMAKGLNFTAATARTLASAGKILLGLDLKLPVILMNGVLIYDMAEKKIRQDKQPFQEALRSYHKSFKRTWFRAFYVLGFR